MKLERGFSLLELMIVVVVIGIMAAIVYPQYVDYVIRGNISGATASLSSRRSEMEQFFQDNGTYVGAPACARAEQGVRNFQFQCNPAPTQNTYTLQAVGINNMAPFSFTVTNTGAKASAVGGGAPAGWAGNGNCWITGRGGAC